MQFSLFFVTLGYRNRVVYQDLIAWKLYTKI